MIRKESRTGYCKKMLLIVIATVCVFLAACNENQGKAANASPSQTKQSTATVTKSGTTTTKDQKKQSDYIQYTNSKFGYSIEYPSTFVEKVIPESETEKLDDNIKLLKREVGIAECIPTKDSGKVFTSVDGSGELIIIGDDHPNNLTAKDDYDEILRHHDNVTYKMQEGNWFVVSWIDDCSTITYLKEVIEDGKCIYFKITYPSNQKNSYDAIVAHLTSSLKTK